MKIINISSHIIGACLFSFFSLAQNENTYTRPSVSSVFITSGVQNESLVFQSISELPMEKRFDTRNIQTKQLSFNFPPQPQLKQTENPLEMRKAMQENQVAQTKWQNDCQKIVDKQLGLVGREIVSDQWSRDANGNFDYQALMESAQYSATDADALKSSASADKGKIYSEIADKLLKKNYVIAYTLTKMQTMEEYYNEQDKTGAATAKALKKEYKPVKRTKEGWNLSFKFDIYKLKWNDSIQSIFYNDMYIDQSTQTGRSEKISKFENTNFSMEKVYSGFASASSTQSNNPDAYKFTKRKSMSELVSGLAPSMQSNAIFAASRKVDDFKLKAPVLSERPLTAKLGTKEGLYVDQRFFAYEYELDKKGNEVKKRTAVVRAVTIAENDTIATGASTPSVFRQHGGKAVYQGTLLEMKEDFGLGLTMGYVLEDQFIGGLHAGLDLRITGITGKILKPKVNKLLRSWYLNVNLSYLPKGDNIMFANTDPFTGNEIGEIIWGASKAQTSSLAFGFGMFTSIPVVG